jgi:hypothetical protein
MGLSMYERKSITQEFAVPYRLYYPDWFQPEVPHRYPQPQGESQPPLSERELLKAHLAHKTRTKQGDKNRYGPDTAVCLTLYSISSQLIRNWFPTSTDAMP